MNLPWAKNSRLSQAGTKPQILIEKIRYYLAKKENFRYRKYVYGEDISDWQIVQYPDKAPFDDEDYGFEAAMSIVSSMSKGFGIQESEWCNIGNNEPN